MSPRDVNQSLNCVSVMSADGMIDGSLAPGLTRSMRPTLKPPATAARSTRSERTARSVGRSSGIPAGYARIAGAANAHVYSVSATDAPYCLAIGRTTRATLAAKSSSLFMGWSCSAADTMSDPSAPPHDGEGFRAQSGVSVPAS